MISTGNDIVALAAIDKDRTCHSRFYSRIVLPDEMERLGFVGLPFPSFVWLLWSIKESVYKYVSRSDTRLVFSPLKIPVERLVFQGDLYEGTICYDQRLLYSRSFLEDGTILTVVSEERDFAHTRWGLQAIGDPGYATQTAAVRSYALESLAALFPHADLRILKAPDGPPELWDGDRPLDIPLSLAHHDRYVAWSYRLTANSSSYRKSAAN